MNKEILKEYRMPNNTKCYFSTAKFARVIRDIRRELGGTERKSKQDFFEDLAESTGISVSSLNHWVMGHNAPSDIEKLQSIADALHVDLMDIVETETGNNNYFDEDKKMGNEYVNSGIRNAVVLPNDFRIDYLEPKNIVRGIYLEMVDYIEVFRKTLAFEYDSFGEHIDSLYAGEQYSKIISSIRKSMLDIPIDTYKKLLQFTEGFLSNMMGDEFEVADIWDLSLSTEEELKEAGIDLNTMNPYTRRFVYYNNYCKKNDRSDNQLEYVLMIANLAYEILEEILANYLVN